MKANQIPKREKNSMPKILVLLGGLFLSLSVTAQTFEICPEDKFSPENLYRLRKPTDTLISPQQNPTWVYVPFETYEGCPSQDSNLRSVGFIHGLGGSLTAWDKQIRFTDSLYNVSSFGVDYSSGSYEVSFYHVGQKVLADLKNGFENSDRIYATRSQTPRCQKDDYVIAHSQGGIAARYLDWQWNRGSNSFGVREYYGLVTFGTPHAGADVALTKNEHYGFVADVISTIILHWKDEVVYDLTGSFPGTFIGNKVYKLEEKLDTMIKNHLAPLMLSSVHQPTLDEMAPGSYLINSLNQYNSKLHRVAFYGIEDEPECWRVMDQLVTKAADKYPLWGAQPDDQFIQRMEEVRTKHLLQIEENNREIDRRVRWKGNSSSLVVTPLVAVLVHWGLNQKIQSLRIENQKRTQSVEFLNHANTQWRYLIGSYHRDSFDFVQDTVFEVDHLSYNGNGYSATITEFSNRADAEAFANRAFGGGQVTWKTRVRKVMKFYPSDGVVLARSQKAFPGITESNIDFMPHNNHFQERNSSETHRVLRRLYEGGKYDPYFILKY